MPLESSPPTSPSSSARAFSSHPARQLNLYKRDPKTQSSPDKRGKRWQDFSIEEGMPLPRKDLTTEEVQSILGVSVSKGDGNHILRVANYARESGKLDYETYLGKDWFLEFAEALEWLDREYPSGMQTGATSPHGRGVLDELQHYQKMKKALDVAQNIRKDAEGQQRVEEGGANAGPLAKDAPNSGALAQPREKSEWLKYWEDRGMISKEVDPNKIKRTTFQRLFPSFLVVISTVAFSIILAGTYEPPTGDQRLFPHVPAAIATTYALISLNVVTFIAWRFPPMWRLMNKYFIVVPALPSAASMFLSVFSQQTVGHLLTNCLCLLIIGPYLHQDIGRGNFLALYLSAGVVGAYASLARSVLLRQFNVSSLGASGAISGTISGACLWRNREEWHIPLTDFTVPFSSYALWAFLVIGEIVSFRKAQYRQSGLDHACHLGGYAAGAIGIAVIRLREEYLKKQRIEADRYRKMGVLGGYAGAIDDKKYGPLKGVKK